MANESVVIYQTWYESAELMGEEKRRTAIDQIIRYGLYGEEPKNDEDPVMKMLMMNWMPLVDAQKKKRKGGAPTGNQNAKGRGAPKGNQNARKTNNQNKQPFNVKGNDNGNNNANYNYPLPSVDTLANGGARDTTLGESQAWSSMMTDWDDEDDE